MSEVNQANADYELVMIQLVERMKLSRDILELAVDQIWLKKRGISRLEAAHMLSDWDEVRRILPGEGT